MSLKADYLEAFETHSPDGIRKALAAGASPTAPIDGIKPIEILIEMYLRSPRFADCLRVMLEAGAVIEDPLLQAVLLDDEAAVRAYANTPGQRVDRRLTQRCAFTPCEGASALHLCAEYNSVRCAAAFLKLGLEVDDRAETDAEGFGGHTPLFHSVNSNQNYCRPVMELLVDAGAALDIRVRGLVWGKGFEWETTVFDVTPISYAQCGLYRQFHRREEDIFSNIAYMYRKRYGTEPPVRNVPNRYLAS
jgi:hypothetical protein